MSSDAWRAGSRSIPAFTELHLCALLCGGVLLVPTAPVPGLQAQRRCQGPWHHQQHPASSSAFSDLLLQVPSANSSRAARLGDNVGGWTGWDWGDKAGAESGH